MRGSALTASKNVGNQNHLRNRMRAPKTPLPDLLETCYQSRAEFRSPTLTQYSHSLSSQRARTVEELLGKENRQLKSHRQCLRSVVGRPLLEFWPIPPMPTQRTVRLRRTEQWRTRREEQIKSLLYLSQGYCSTAHLQSLLLTNSSSHFDLNNQRLNQS